MKFFFPALLLLFFYSQLFAFEKNMQISSDSIKETIISRSSFGDVTFPHKKHVIEYDVECNQCHHEINAKKLSMPHENYFEDFWINCRSCHHDQDAPKKAASCSACHHASPSNIADETLSTKVVIHKSCWSCHTIERGKNATQGCIFCHSADINK